MENKFLQVKAVQDESCHWYIVPNALCEEFYQDSLNEEFIESGEFSEKWSQFSTDGDLNNVQLWIEKLAKSRYSWDKFPKWVKYVAIDERGDMFGYEEEPKRHYRGYWAKCDGKSCLLENVGLTPDWENSLEERPKK